MATDFQVTVLDELILNNTKQIERLKLFNAFWNREILAAKGEVLKMIQERINQNHAEASMISKMNEFFEGKKKEYEAESE